MDKRKLLDAGLTFALMLGSAYIGYVFGTYRMASAYGEAMSAEAIMYLAAKDSE